MKRLRKITNWQTAVRGIEIKSLNFSLEGDIDINAFLGLFGIWGIDTRPGYQSIKINCKIESDASIEELEKLCDYIQIANKVPVTINME